MPVYDTDAEALTRLLGPASSADWGTGQRQADPGADEIFTIRLRNGNVFRLAGLHIMTKETRHWMWMTMWWSDRPDEDFGADRPAFIRNGLDGVWSNYKMCVASAYEEGDVDPTRSLLLTPSLASALSASGISGAPTWCSNPYLEHGRGNARTNCIGCHQHGGSTHAFDAAGDATAETFDLEAVITNDALFPNNGRSQIRSVFPTDYVWATVRVDDLIQVMGREIEWRDDGDQNSVPGRARRVVELGGDSNEGELTFDVKCTSCHGVDGAGGFGPSLWERVPMRDDIDLATTLIGGRGAMPAWGPVFDDATLGNLVAFLRGRFDGERGAE